MTSDLYETRATELEDPRVEIAAKAIFTGILYGGTEDEWEQDEERRDWCRNIAHDVLEALGLRMAETVADLSSLGLGAVLRDARHRTVRLGIQTLGERNEITNRWLVAGSYVNDDQIVVPAIVIHDPSVLQ